MISKAKMARIRKGFTIKDFAILVGCHETQISNFEHGRWSLPEKWREVVSNGLEVKASDIMDERGLALWIEE